MKKGGLMAALGTRAPGQGRSVGVWRCSRRQPRTPPWVQQPDDCDAPGHKKDAAPAAPWCPHPHRRCTHVMETTW